MSLSIKAKGKCFICSAPIAEVRNLRARNVCSAQCRRVLQSGIADKYINSYQCVECIGTGRTGESACNNCKGKGRLFKGIISKELGQSLLKKHGGLTSVERQEQAKSKTLLETTRQRQTREDRVNTYQEIGAGRRQRTYGND